MRSLQHYAFEVPDLEVGRKFYTDFGLEGAEVGETVVMRCAGRDQDQVVMREGPKKRLHHISLGTTADELDGMRAELAARGVAFEDPPYDGPARSEPDVEINARGHNHRLNARGVPEDGTEVSRPRRLGHILLFTRSVPAKVEFYTGALGMKLSDTMGGDVVGFMRCGNGGDHHVIALAKSEQPGFHHSSWEFGTVDDIGVATANMFDRGHAHCWGFGRHVVGSNYFHYFRDPWGSLVEHFTDIDVIGEDADWKPKDWLLEGNLSRWATEDAPDDFLMNSEAAA
jgi:catechol 2,3-dioxygenase-like lactoylglutathione lyase family enzyme